MVRAVALLLSAGLGVGCAPPSAPSDGTDDTVVAPLVVRRLGRHEYDNTLRDLLGARTRPGARFPADDHAHGFDTIATALTVSPSQLELYELATEQVVDELSNNPDAWAQIVRCDPSEAGALPCARATVEAFTPIAWRRPLKPSEHEELLALYDEAIVAGDSFADAMKQVIRATLLSPHFLFRIERDDDAGVHRVTDHELATRLSYFLWSSMPDASLREAADDGRLHDDEEIAAHVRRMLRDPKAEALVDNFAGQWLYIRALDDVFRDTSRFPGFDEQLRTDMKDELRAMFRSFIDENRDIRELLVSNRTFASGRLASHYGVASSPHDGVSPLDLTALPRVGWLTTPGLMTALSPPFRTSPPQRGRWVLSQLLCQPLAPPPPGVTAAANPDGATTMRERLEAHQADPACAGCHAAMDPIGLAFEHYDAVGAYRTRDQGVEVDASGQLPDGPAFDDALELAEIIAEDPAFIDCTVRQVFTYAMGRAPVGDDEAHLEYIGEQFAAADYRFAELLIAIAQSAPFRQRMPQAAGGGQ